MIADEIETTKEISIKKIAYIVIENGIDTVLKISINKLFTP
jgi:hypothetical protein